MIFEVHGRNNDGEGISNPKWALLGSVSPNGPMRLMVHDLHYETMIAAGFAFVVAQRNSELAESATLPSSY